MARIFYVHWDEDEAQHTVRLLRAAGHKVGYHWSSGDEAWKLVQQSPPDALVISLARLPSHGRAVAQVINESQRLRDLPLIFVGGEVEKVAVTRSKFPKATYCTAARLTNVLERVKPFAEPDSTAPRQRHRAPAGAASAAGYSGTPLPQKLGIKAGHRVTLVNAPDGFPLTLGELPPGVSLESKFRAGRSSDVIVLFARDLSQLEGAFATAARQLVPNGGLWVAWPKKASGVATDLHEALVRGVGLASGLVDNKVCAVDETWSGLRFVTRVKDREALPERRPGSGTRSRSARRPV